MTDKAAITLRRDGNEATCTLCGETRPMDSFHRDASKSSGFKRYCKACAKARHAPVQQATRRSDKGRERRREWARTRTLSGAAIERERRKSRRRHHRYPEKALAHRLVREAIVRGDIVKPTTCTRCNAVPRPRRDGASTLQAHHSDYSKPLDVSWLCVGCHTKEHLHEHR